jgi:hypothetical protein
VHVLQLAHGWLRPRGRLLDIHPEPEGAAVEIQVNREVVPVGPFERPTIDEKIRVARASLGGLVTAGQYVAERFASFEIVSHHVNVDAWLEYRAQRNATSSVDPALLERARDMQMTLGGDELRVRERIRAGRYRRQMRRW